MKCSVRMSPSGEGAGGAVWWYSKPHFRLRGATCRCRRNIRSIRSCGRDGGSSVREVRRLLRVSASVPSTERRSSIRSRHRRSPCRRCAAYRRSLCRSCRPARPRASGLRHIPPVRRIRCGSRRGSLLPSGAQATRPECPRPGPWHIGIESRHPTRATGAE